jgi:hypothetical protein
MTLFPQIDPAYYGDEDKNVREMIEYFYAQAIQINQSFWSEADIDSRFKAGDQTLWNDIYGNLPAFRRRQFNFNRIRRVVNMITGYQRQHRFSTVVTPVMGSDEVTADQLSKTMIWVNNDGNILETISEAFEGAITTGMNLLSCWMDYRQDPINGDIRVDNVSYNEYLIDPFFKKKDMSDCRFCWTRKWLSKTEIKSLLPDYKAEIDSMYARGWRDGKFQFQPEAYNYAMQDLLTYDEFYYLDYRPRKMLVDTSTGETLEWKGEESGMQEFMGVYPEISVVDQLIPTVKLVILVKGRVLYHGKNPMGIDKYPFIPVFAYYEPQIPYFPWRCQGVVRGLRDAQYLYNRRKIIELDILESQINSGIKYKEGSLINPKDAFLTGQGRSLALKQEASMDDVQQIIPPQIPPSMIQLSELLGREIQEISGVNEELLGSATDDKAGVLSMLRQGAGLTTLQILFDQLNQSQKYLGELTLDLIQANFGPGKIKRIIGEEPSEQFYSRAFQKYDLVVEEGLNTSTQRQMNFAQLMQLRELQVPVPTGLLIESSTLQNKRALIEAIQKEEQSAQEMQQKQAEAENQVKMATMASLEAKAFADKGLGMERLARVEENSALAIERVAQAEKDRSQSVYEEIKAAKELEHMDLDALHKFVEFVERLKSLHQSNEESQLAKEEKVA